MKANDLLKIFDLWVIKFSGALIASLWFIQPLSISSFSHYRINPTSDWALIGYFFFICFSTFIVMLMRDSRVIKSKFDSSLLFVLENTLKGEGRSTIQKLFIRFVFVWVILSIDIFMILRTMYIQEWKSDLYYSFLGTFFYIILLFISGIIKDVIKNKTNIVGNK